MDEMHAPPPHVVCVCVCVRAHPDLYNSQHALGDLYNAYMTYHALQNTPTRDFLDFRSVLFLFLIEKSSSVHAVSGTSSPSSLNRGAWFVWLRVGRRLHTHTTQLTPEIPPPPNIGPITAPSTQLRDVTRCPSFRFVPIYCSLLVWMKRQTFIKSNVTSAKKIK